jgi:ATP synthase protein I
MKPPAVPPERDPFLDALRVRAARQARWLRDGEPSSARRLAQIGVLGWIVVVPMLMGALGGRWLDGRLHSGIFWTAPLLMLGLVLGCWSAWKWVQTS